MTIQLLVFIETISFLVCCIGAMLPDDYFGVEPEDLSEDRQDYNYYEACCSRYDY